LSKQNGNLTLITRPGSGYKELLTLVS